MNSYRWTKIVDLDNINEATENQRAEVSKSAWHNDDFESHRATSIHFNSHQVCIAIHIIYLTSLENPSENYSFP